MDLYRRCMRLAKPVLRAGNSLAVVTLALFAVATLVPLGLALLQTRLDVAAAEDEAVVNARFAALTAAHNVEDLISVARGRAETVSHLDGFWQASDAQRDDMLMAVALPQPQFKTLLFITPDLAQHGSSDAGGRAVRPGLQDRAYAQEALASGLMAATAEPLLSLAPPFAFVLPVAFPVHGDASSRYSGLI